MERPGEDILADPSSILYSAEVHKALNPARDVLQTMFTSPNEDPLGEFVPAKEWLEDQGMNIEDTISTREPKSPETHIGLNKEARVLWMERLPIPHAHTIFIAFRIRKDPRYKGPHYIHFKAPTPVLATKARPRPQPKKKGL
ncbi:hypothetical protein M413DRAFT_7416 [Hebeloma cylindrosporum]|uniref:Uncharacterized protein n=1 Tax=Hebeloma cylindrosporum TaxID=76867 RepID=A0A0C2Y9Y0_HEBCY|nr:hypothetical protein M413DRAFT_14377 [Hebeloma cylindrosporum h7]KIM46608.1 hypothetical protein M413DRAFT_7416 [Hebeloma cylindrosporum h7]